MKAEKPYSIVSKWEEQAENGDGVLMPARPKK